MKDMYINYFIYLIWNIIDMYIILRYMNRLYGKMNKGKYRLYTIASLLVLFTTIAMNPDRYYNNIIAITVMSLFLLYFFEKNIQKKILFSAILLTIAGFCGAIAEFISTLFPDIENLTELLTLCLCHFGFAILIEIAPHLMKNEQKKLSIRIWCLLLSIPIISIIGYFCIAIMVMNSSMSNRASALLGLPLLMIILYINLMVFYLSDRFTALVIATSQKKLLAQQVDYQSKYYQHLEKNQETIRSIKHDMKNNLQTAIYLLNDRKSEELNEHLLELTNHIGTIEKIISTENTALDAILNMKILEMRELDIEVHTNISVPKDLKITFEQAVIIFGNIMDNAKEACLSLPNDMRIVKLKIFYISNMLYIRLQNPMDKNIDIKNNLPESTKSDSLLHGIGLKNVQRLVEDLQGTMGFKTDDSNFLIKIIIYNL